MKIEIEKLGDLLYVKDDGKESLTNLTESKTIQLDTLNKITDFASDHYRQIVNLEEKLIREALEALGWTPPDKDYCATCKHQHSAMDDYPCMHCKHFRSSQYEAEV